MLELKKIVKHYRIGDNVVKALRGIDLKFRQSEFVAILGPSGCGKTTLLNIIGGLDQYTSGDVIINNKSTKNFIDKDWDAYRNHSIGFVFQSYNLIPHQTVLKNVEIALTISGVSKEIRRAKSIKALKEVGLGDQLNKRPNQLSGGQMQRVAIARALVNNPEIILADEPTGALDTETGMQVMEILKKISKDRLVIVVTHNPILAEKYSTRTIKMLDGKIIDDSLPLSKNEKTKSKKETNSNPSMSFGTAFMLSLNNLFTKKGRTLLTAFAGSIGIMGIALILAVSQGMTRYIDNVQEDALASYPLTIEETSVDLTMLMKTFMDVGKSSIEHEKDAVYKKTAIYDMVTALSNLESRENDLKTFKKHLEKEYKKKDNMELNNAITGLQYSYDLDLYIYTQDSKGDILKSDPRELLQNLMVEHMGMDMSSMFSFSNNSPLSEMTSMKSNMASNGLVNMNMWQEILSGKDGEVINDLLKKQYDVVYGTWPQEYNEIVLVLDKNNELDDLTLYALGLETKENMDILMKAAIDGTQAKKSESKWSYQEILDKEYRVILNSNLYNYDEETGFYVDLTNTEAGLKYLYDNALVLKVTGIIRLNENTQSKTLSGAIAYTEKLTKYIIENSKDSDIIKTQKEKKTIDILTGLPFKSNTGELKAEEKKSELKKYINTLNNKGKAEIYIKIMSIPSDEEIQETVNYSLKKYNRTQIEKMMIDGLKETMNIEKETIENYITSMADEELNNLFAKSIEEQFKRQYAVEVATSLAPLTEETLSEMLDKKLLSSTDKEYELYYEEVMVFSENTYENNLAKMGYVEIETPKVMNIFASSFNSKEIIEAAIEDYNKGKPELSQIKYTDYLGIMMSSITSIINAITYVLLAFVAISLIVSSIMIGVITLISVQERTKEIGILRAIGASKANVSNMFNAETMIIGLTSGLIGIIVTYILCIPINIILHRITGIKNLNAFLPFPGAVILVIISVILSLFAGFIPSRSAAKKDPVVALRTE